MNSYGFEAELVASFTELKMIVSDSHQSEGPSTVKETTRAVFISSKKQIAAIMFIVLIAGVGTLSACNTTEGVGKDIKSVGRGIEETAHDAK